MVPCNHDHVCCCRPAHAGRLACSRFTKEDRKSTRLNSSHSQISYAVFCLKKKKISDGSHPSQNDCRDQFNDAFITIIAGTTLLLWLQGMDSAYHLDSRTAAGPETHLISL